MFDLLLILQNLLHLILTQQSIPPNAPSLPNKHWKNKTNEKNFHISNINILYEGYSINGFVYAYVIETH